jgi:threonine/homoserine/homoserine lactone efflux protein
VLLSTDQTLGFLLAAVVITAAPGPDNLMLLGIGMSGGRSRGMAFGLGCALGCITHTLLAALGIGALVAASPVAFTALKICGGMYLIWLGVQALRQGKTATIDMTSGAAAPAPLKTLFVRGLFANSINPKVILFFLSFVPQFVLIDRGSPSWQTAQLGLLFTAQAAVLFGLLGYFSGAIGQWLRRSQRAGLWMDRVTGCVLIGLGARIMLSRR